jgi:hypothetical protein
MFALPAPSHCLAVHSDHTLKLLNDLFAQLLTLQAITTTITTITTTTTTI